MASVTQKEQLELFLSTYKELEQLIDTNHGQTIFEYESGLETTKSKKLQLCRNIRNYVQHNEDGFLFASVSDTMLDFVKSLCTEERAKMANNDEMIVKPFVKKKLSDTVVSGAKLLLSKDIDFLPVLDDDKKLAGVLSRENMLRISCSCEVNGNLTFADVLKYVKPDTKRILFVKAKDKASDTVRLAAFHEFDMILVTNDGTKTGKVLGKILLV